MNQNKGYQKQILFGKAMRRSQKSTSNKKYSSQRGASTTRQKEAEELKNIMNGIKYLQQKVNNLPVSHFSRKSVKGVPTTPKASIKYKNSIPKFNTSSGKKVQNREQSAKKKTKLEINPSFNSKIMNCENKTIMIKSPQVNRPQEYSAQPQIMENYMSLQLENFKLERHNFHLEKQLLEQSLMMERRQKQILKNKLKRIKTQTNQNDKNIKEAPIKDKIQTPVVSSFDVSPIKIKIPQISLVETKISHNGKENKYSAVRKYEKIDVPKKGMIRVEEQADSLLLSEENESCIKQSPQKTTESVLEQQLWELLGQGSRKQGKGSARQALGDIANRLKFVRNK